jgi:hypothetical protein
LRRPRDSETTSVPSRRRWPRNGSRCGSPFAANARRCRLPRHRWNTGTHRVRIVQKRRCRVGTGCARFHPANALCIPLVIDRVPLFRSGWAETGTRRPRTSASRRRWPSALRRTASSDGYRTASAAGRRAAVRHARRENGWVTRTTSLTGDAASADERSARHSSGVRPASRTMPPIV